MEKKELKDLKVRDVLMMDEFRNQLSQVMDAEVDSQRRAASNAEAQPHTPRQATGT